MPTNNTIFINFSSVSRSDARSMYIHLKSTKFRDTVPLRQKKTLPIHNHELPRLLQKNY